MSWRDDNINDALSAVPLALLSGLLLVLGTLAAHAVGGFYAPDPMQGLFYSLEPLHNVIGSVGSMVVSLLATTAVVLLTVALNRLFSFVRAVTHVHITTFLMLQLACPWAMVSMGTGTWLLLFTVLAAFVLFANYQGVGTSQRGTFLTFAVACTCCLEERTAIILPILLVMG